MCKSKTLRSGPPKTMRCSTKVGYPSALVSASQPTTVRTSTTLVDPSKGTGEASTKAALRNRRAIGFRGYNKDALTDAGLAKGSERLDPKVKKLDSPWASEPSKKSADVMFDRVHM